MLKVCMGSMLSILALASAAVAQSSYAFRVWASNTQGVPLAPTRFGMHVTRTGENVYATGRTVPSLSSTAMAVWRVNADGTLAWTASIAPSGSTDCNGVAVTSDNNGKVFVAGYVNGTTGKDLMTACYQDNGTSVTQLWSHRYNNGINNANGDDVPVVISYHQSTNAVYVGANSEGASATSASLGTDLFVLKYSATSGGSGPLWTQRWDGAAHGNDTLADLKVVEYGETNTPLALFVAGTVAQGATKNDFMALSLDLSTGAIINSRAYNYASSGNDVAASLDAYANSETEGQVFITGYTTGAGTASDDYLTIAVPLNLPAAVTWSRFYNGVGGGTDRAVDVIYRSDYVVVTGESYGGLTTGYDFATTKYDAATGADVWTITPVVWFNNPNGYGEDRAADMVVDKDGNIYVGGKSFNGSTLDFGAVSYTAAGAERWIYYDAMNCYPTVHHIEYNGTANGTDFGASIGVTLDGGLIDHDGDFFMFGSVTTLSGSTTLVKHGVVKWTQTDTNPCP